MTFQLLALPGLGLNETAWRPALTSLGESSVVLRIPGYGHRARRGVDLSPRALAGDVATRRLPGQPVVIMGHSASCQVAAHVAVLARPRVAGLVLVGPTTRPGAATWPRMAAQWLRTARREPKGQGLSLTRQYSQTGLGTMRRAMDQARRDRIEQTLRTVEAPVLLLRGTDDQICTEGWAEQLGQVPRDSGMTSVVTLPAGAHMVPLTHGPLVADALRPFLAALSARNS